MKNITKIAIFLIGTAIVLAPAAASAQLSGGGSTAVETTLSGGGSSAPSSTPAPTLSGGGSSAVAASPSPSLSGGGSSAVAASPRPSLSGGGSSAVPANNPGVTLSGGGSSAVAATPAPTTNTGGGSTSGGSSGGGNIGGGSGGSFNYSSCVLVGTHLNVGATGVEVTKLQNFLRNMEYLNVAVTGVYDAQTVAAVKAFQTKYASEVLAPWGLTAPTGYMYITTLAKINNRACNLPLTLNATQLAEINAYKARVAAGFGVENEVVGQADGSPVLSGTVGSPSSSPIASNGATSSNDSQVAAAGQTNIFAKIWNFIKRIFGR